jgi:hypothetical protein
MRLTFSRTRNPENRVQKQDLLVLPVLRPALPLRLRAFLRDPAAVLGLAIVAAAIIAALAAPVLAPTILPKLAWKIASCHPAAPSRWAPTTWAEMS